jgi:hypothetical protein
MAANGLTLLTGARQSVDSIFVMSWIYPVFFCCDYRFLLRPACWFKGENAAIGNQNHSATGGN